MYQLEGLNKLRLRFFCSVFGLILCFAPFSSGICSNIKIDESIVATANGETISETELYYFLNKYRREDDDFKGEAGKREFLNRLIKFKLMVSVAKQHDEDKNPLLLVRYENYMRSRYSELFKKNLVEKVKVTQDDIDIAFVESDKSGKRKTKEQIKTEKEGLEKALYPIKFKKLLYEEVEKLKKKNNIIVHDNILDDIDAGKDVEAESIVFEVKDEKYSYKKLQELIPDNVRHSPENMLKRKDFLIALINKEIETTLMVNETKRLDLGKSDIYFHIANNEFYEKILVQLLDYNKEYTEMVYGKVEVSDGEIEEYYNTNKEKYADHETVLKIFKLIFNSEDDAKNVHDGLIKNGFKAQDVIKENESKLKDKNYDIGYVSQVELTEELGDKLSTSIFKLKAGDISNIYSVNDSFMIIVIDDEKTNIVAPLDKVKPAVEKTLRMQKSQKAFDDYWDKLEKNADISINEVILKKVPVE